MEKLGSGGLDAHHHFWSYDPEQYSWISDSMSRLRRDFLPADLKPELDRAGLDGSVVVQARQTLEETRWLLELAEANSWIEGVVGWVDLRADDVESVISSIRHPKLLGVRHVVQDEPDDEFLLREDFRRGVSIALDAGLRYEVLIYERQLPATLRFCEEFADHPLILDHIAKPLIADGALEPWATRIRELARIPTLTCKVSAMVNEAKWNGWKHEDFRPYLDVVFEAFGVERLMYGSDWPVCLAAAEDYAQVGAIVDRYTAQLSEDQRAQLFGGNARRVYGL